MKIVRDNKLYVQNKDLARLMMASVVYGVGLPSEVVNKVFGDIFVVNEENEKKYIDFEEKESIDFFDKLPYIVDYDKIKEMTEEGIQFLLRCIIEEINEICDEFNSLSDESKNKKYYETITKVQLLEHKFYDVRNILWEKQGHIKNSMPEQFGIVYKLRMAFSKKNRK